jgi:hypothetical protein
MKRLTGLLLLFGLVPLAGALTTPLLGQGLGLTWDGDVVLFDLADGQGGVVATTPYAEVNAMTKAADGRLLGVSNDGPGRMFEIDPQTFATTELALVAVTDIRGLAGFPCDPDLLYAVESSAGSQSDLYAMDISPPTGKTFIGKITHGGIQGLAFAPDGTLYGWSTGYGLIEISPFNATSTNVSGANDGHSDIQALTFLGGQLYGIREDVYAIDRNTGQDTLVQVGPLGDLRGADFTSGLCATWDGCPPTSNSVGNGALLRPGGSLSILANSFQLEMTASPPGQFAILFYGLSPSSAPLGDGTLCVGSPQYRFPVSQIDPSGSLVQAIDFTAPPAGSGPGKVEPGTSINFQSWFRDTTPGGSNLSQSVVVVFCP